MNTSVATPAGEGPGPPREDGLQLRGRGRAEGRHVDARGDPQPAPAGVPGPRQGAPLLRRRDRRLVGAGLRRRLHRAAPRPRPPVARRRQPHLPLLAARARADAGLRPPPAAHRGVPRPPRAAVLPLGDAALAQPGVAGLARLPHRVAAHLAARRGARRRTHDAVAAHDRPGARVLRRAAAARLRACSTAGSGCCWRCARCSATSRRPSTARPTSSTSRASIGCRR